MAAFKKALIAYQCEKCPNYWGVIYIDDKTLDCIHQSLISHYRNSCWNCGTLVDSSINSTSPICHWVKCPVCGACRKGGCIKEGFTNP